METNTTSINVHLAALLRRAAIPVAAGLLAIAACPALSSAQAVHGVAPMKVQVRAEAGQVPPTIVQVPPPTVQVVPPVVEIPDKVELDALKRSLDAMKPAIDDLALKALDRIDMSRLTAMAMSLADMEMQQARTVLRGTQPVIAFAGRDESSLYEAGLSLLDSEQWQRAVDMFDRVIKGGKTHVDGAMYWKAYALDRLGQRPDALAALQELTKAYPNSRYLGDAKALEIEVKQNAGQPAKPEDHANEDLKLIAINSLMQSDPDRAIPLLEQVLKGRDSPKVKQRALLVLSTSDSPKARDALVTIARGAGNPDLQMKAIRYLGVRNRANGQLLADIYGSTKDTDVKREILRSLGMSREVDQLLNIAKTEPSPELRIEAIRQLGMSRAGNKLVSLYWSEGSPNLRSEIVRSMIASGDAAGAAELAKKEADAKTRASAVRSLGATDSAKTGDALVQIYKNDKDQGVKKAVVDALRMQNNAKALVDLARGETDPVMKKEIVSRLSTMKSKEATDYMLELLK
jgi:tetratricopeptide (TPR) repeat protein